jgi:hypothetical protein
MCRIVRVILAEGKVERILDDDDGTVVYLFENEDQQSILLAQDMLDEEMFKFDRCVPALCSA